MFGFSAEVDTGGPTSYAVLVKGLISVMIACLDYQLHLRCCYLLCYAIRMELYAGILMPNIILCCTSKDVTELYFIYLLSLFFQ